MPLISLFKAKAAELLLMMVTVGVCSIALAQSPLTPTGGPFVSGTSHQNPNAFSPSLEAYRELQSQIHQLTPKWGTGSFSLSKAQCWLDVSKHEYMRRDTSAFAKEALEESSKIAQFIRDTQLSAAAAENATANPAIQTPMVDGSPKIRPDLWEAASRIKAGPQCVRHHGGCLEVLLVHAGHELQQRQWRHAQPYVQMAEDLVDQAGTDAAKCPETITAKAPVITPATPQATPTAPSVIQPAVVTPRFSPLNFTATVLFDFDEFAWKHTRAASVKTLDDAIQQTKASGYVLRAVRLVGHADISNNTGQSAYNIELSLSRSRSVRDYLISQGFAGNLIEIDAKSDTQQLQVCDRKKFKTVADYRECLLPNRRVNVEFIGVRQN